MSLRPRLRFAAQRITGRAGTCGHVDQIRDVRPDSNDGCPECIAGGDSWVHLRVCMTCGHVGCCDSSKNRHATRHAHDAHHPILASREPGEDWMWCVIDERMVAPPS